MVTKRSSAAKYLLLLAVVPLLLPASSAEVQVERLTVDPKYPVPGENVTIRAEISHDAEYVDLEVNYGDGWKTVECSKQECKGWWSFRAPEKASQDIRLKVINGVTRKQMLEEEKVLQIRRKNPKIKSYSLRPEKINAGEVFTVEVVGKDWFIKSIEAKFDGKTRSRICISRPRCTAELEFRAPEKPGDYRLRIVSSHGVFGKEIRETTVEVLPSAREGGDGGDDGAGDNGEEDGRPPEADFTWQPAYPEADEKVSFDAGNSEDPDGDIESYSWEFGDGGEESGQKATYAFSRAGTYMVQLTVTDSEGNRDSRTQRIRVSKPDAVCDLNYGQLRVRPWRIFMDETANVSITITNDGTRQEVRVTFKSGEERVREVATELEKGESRKFVAEVAPDSDQHIRAIIESRGRGCGYSYDERTAELAVVNIPSGQEGSSEMNASVNVSVRTDEGEPVENAKVVLENGESQLGYTGPEGTVRLESGPGKHTLTVSEDGYRTETRKVTLVQDSQVDISVRLERNGESLTSARIIDIEHPESVCRGGSFRAYVHLSNSGQRDLIELEGTAPGTTAHRELMLGEGKAKFPLVFTEIKGLGEQDFAVKIEGTSKEMESTIEVKDCTRDGYGQPRKSISVAASDQKILSGTPVSIRGVVDGVTERSVVEIRVDGEVRGRTIAGRDGYFSTYLRLEKAGTREVAALSGQDTSTVEITVQPTAEVSFDTERPIYAGQRTDICARVESQVSPRLVLQEDGEVVAEKKGSGLVCFDIVAPGEGIHHYRVTAMTAGRKTSDSMQIDVKRYREEAELFPRSLSMTESGSGLAKVELYNNRKEPRTYSVRLSGVPERWYSISEKTVRLSPAQSRTVYIYINPLEEGKFAGKVHVTSGHTEILEKRLDIFSGGRYSPGKRDVQPLNPGTDPVDTRDRQVDTGENRMTLSAFGDALMKALPL